MKPGNIVLFKNLHKSWGKVGLIIKVHKTEYGLGQIYILSRGARKTIPWIKRDKYLEILS